MHVKLKAIIICMFFTGEESKKLYMIWSGRVGKYPFSFL